MTTINNKRIQLNEQAASPATPPSGSVSFYAKTDGKVYRKNSAGVETEIGIPSDFNSVLLNEVSPPATPASGKVIIYARSDGLVYSKDDAGVETLMSSGESRTKLIASGTPTSSSFTISSIPNTYAHLKLYFYVRSTHSSEDFLNISVGNGSIDTSASNYARNSISVAGTTVSGTGDSGAAANLLTNCSAGSSTVPNRFSFLVVDFINYASSFHKGIVFLHKASIGTAAGDQKFVTGGGHWLSTSAIDILRVSLGSGNFASGSRYELYGILG